MSLPASEASDVSPDEKIVPPKKNIIEKMLPFALTAFAIAADQISKFFIVKNWPLPENQPWGVFIKDVFGNNFLEIWHVRNKAIAFSIGHNLPDMIRPLLFIIVPVAVLVLLVVYYFKSDEFTRLQRWAVAGILGGGIGNLIDRFFRPEGVVDFISVNFPCPWDKLLPAFSWGSRWPTFNFADSFVVIFGLLLLATVFIFSRKKDEVR